MLAAAVAGAAAILLGFTGSASRALSRRTGRTPAEEAHGLFIALSPLILLDLVFLQFLVFLRDIRPVLGPVAFAASAFLIADHLLRRRASHPVLVNTRLDLWLADLVAKPRKTFKLLVGVSFAVYVLLASGAAFPPQPLTGDEPHYLLITRSLLADGDIDVFNNYNSTESLDFYPGLLDTHAFPGRRGPNHTYSRHLPGISVLLAPAYAAGELAAGLLAGDPPNPEKRRSIIVFSTRLPVAFMAALLAGFFFLLVLEITGKPGPSFLAWLVFSFAPPHVFYSHLIYPEIPVALIGLLVFRSVIMKPAASRQALFAAGLGIALIPWFGIKYVVIAGTLFLLSALTLFKSSRGPGAWKRALSLSLVPVLSASAYAWFFWDLYARISPLLPYTGSQPGANQGLPPALHAGAFGVFRYGFGFLFDQRYGIFPYAPAFLLSFAGAILLFKSRRKTLILLVALLIPHWALISFAQVWGGYCPPGRLILPAFWVLAVFMGVAFASVRGRADRTVVTGVVILGFLGALAGLANPGLLNNEHHFMVPEARFVYGRLPAALSNSVVDLKNWIPSFSSWAVLKMPALYAWLAAAAILTGMFVRRRKAGGDPPARFRPATVRTAVIGTAALAVALAFFNARLGDPLPVSGSKLTFYFQDGNTHGLESGGFWTADGRETCVLVRSPERLQSLDVTLSSPMRGKSRVLAGMSEARAERREAMGPPMTVTFPRPVGFPWKGGWLYSLRVRDNAGFRPNRLYRDSTDGRDLGVFVVVSSGS